MKLERSGGASASSVGVMGEALKNRPNWTATVLVGLCLISVGQAFSLQRPVGQKLVTKSEKDNNSKISLPKDSILLVRLGVQPGTGFSWQIKQRDRDRLELIGDPVFVASEQATTGSSEQQEFRFKARTAGSSVLELAYKRAWEEDVPPAKTFKITVMIQ